MKKANLKQNIGILVAAVLIIASLIAPVPANLSRSALYILGIFAAVIELWMTVGVTWPSVFCILALFFAPSTTPNAIIAASMGNPTITFLIFTFCCSWALEQTQFIKRCAIKFLSVPVARTRPWMFMLLYFTSILLLGSIMSTTVIVMIYLTINDQIFELLGLKKGNKTASMMTMGLIIISGISGAITPIAHVFPLMAISIYEKATGETIRYLSYIVSAVPAGILSMLFMLGVFRLIFKPDVSCLTDLDIDAIKAKLTPADRKEKITVGVFLSICLLWILPELIKGILPAVSGYISRMGTAAPPMLGTVLLCVFTADGKPIVSLPKALSNISWVSILMGASALAIGGQLSNADLGITAALTDAISPVLKNVAPFMFVMFMIFFTGFLTNVASNMVIVMLACTIAIPIALTMGDISTPALAACIGMMSAYAFATPPAMTTVAIGLGSGWMTTGDMAKYGFIVLTGACLFVSFVSYPIAAMIM